MLNGTNFKIEQILIDFKFSQIFKFEHILNGTDFKWEQILNGTDYEFEQF
jgi:hypothetical protein